MPLIEVKRPQPDYEKWGQYTAQGLFPQAGLYQQLLPLLFQEQLKSKLQRQQQKELIQDLISGGNGPLGDFKISVGPSGVTYSQKSPKEKLEDIQAQEDLGFYQKPSIPSVIPPVIPPVSTPTIPQDITPAIIPSALQGLSPSERRKAQATMMEEEVKAKGAERKEELKAERSLKQVANAFRGIIAYTKGAEKELGGLGVWPYGAKAKAVSLPFIRHPKYPITQAYYGQKAETTFKLNSILTGQNRVIKGVIQIIMGTIPDVGLDPWPVVKMKTVQSVTNAYKISRAFSKVGYTPERLNAMTQEELDNIPVESLIAGYELTSAEEKQLNAIVEDVLKTPSATVPKIPIGEEKNELPSVVKGIIKPPKPKFNPKTEKLQYNAKLNKYRVVPR